MKYLIAIIQPGRMADVLEKLAQREINLVTASHVVGRGRESAEAGGNVREPLKLVEKVKLEIAVNETYVQAAVDAICEGGRTGQIGDGKIFILDLHDCIRIRTGETEGVAIG